MKQLSIGFRILLTVVFFGVGAAKFAHFETVIKFCAQLGWAEHFSFITGFIEMMCAALLWVKGKQFFAAVLLLIVSTVYLSLLHYMLVGSYTLIITALTASLIYIHRDQV